MAKRKPSHIPKPVYPGGLRALKKFVGEHLRYPAEAKKNRISGTVKVRYSLDYRGKVVDARVKQSLGYGCDEEALRVVRLLRFNVPMDRKKKVRIHQDLNVHFNLAQQEPAPVATPLAPSPPTTAPATAQNIRYVITPTTQKGAGTQVRGKLTKEAKGSNAGYSYTVTITKP